MERLVTTRVSKHEPPSAWDAPARSQWGIATNSGPAQRTADYRCHQPRNECSRFILIRFGTGALRSKALRSLFTPPNPKRLAEAQSLLSTLSALNADGTITEHGKALTKIPLHPRIAHLLLTSGKKGAEIAALLNERDVLSRDAPKDFALRLELLKDPIAFKERYSFSTNSAVLAHVKKEITQLQKLELRIIFICRCLPLLIPIVSAKDAKAKNNDTYCPEAWARIYRDLILLAKITLSSLRSLMAGKEAGIRRAISITKEEIRDLFANDFNFVKSCKWSKRKGRVIAKQSEMFRALSISSVFGRCIREQIAMIVEAIRDWSSFIG